MPRILGRIDSHKRVNDILLGPLERPALKWLSEHMPTRVTPDKLTIVGIFGSVVVFAGYCLTFFDKNFLWLASLGFIINWFGDSLDGTVARLRDIQRPKYGFFVDHTTDAASMVLVFSGLGISPYVRMDIALLTLVGYLLMSVLVYVRTCIIGEFRLSYGRLGPTELRLIAITANTLVYFVGNPVLPTPLISLTVYDLVAFLLAIGLMLVYAVSAIRQANSLATIDQPANILKSGKPQIN